MQKNELKALEKILSDKNILNAEKNSTSSITIEYKPRFNYQKIKYKLNKLNLRIDYIFDYFNPINSKIAKKTNKIEISNKDGPSRDLIIAYSEKKTTTFRL